MDNRPGAIIIEGHVQGLSNVRSLGEAGIPVYVVDKGNCIARYSKYCKKFFQCPDFIKDEFADFLIDLAVKENVKDWVLIPSNDHAVYTLSKHKDWLEEHYKVITPALEVIDNIYDKLSLLDIAEQQGVPIPFTQNFRTADDTVDVDLRFPVITKGRNGLSFYKALHKKALLAEDEAELRHQLNLISGKYAISETFTQELIPFVGSNKTISFTAFCVEGEIKYHWTGVKLREHPLRFGTATFAQSILCVECFRQSVPLIKALNYTGVCEVEYLFDPRDRKYKLIEINARTWLWVGLAKACGVDYTKMIYNHVNGIPIDITANYRTGINWVNPVSDLIFSLIAIFTFRLNPIAYLKSIIKPENVNALILKGDNKPFYRYLTSIFSFLKSR